MKDIFVILMGLMLICTASSTLNAKGNFSAKEPLMVKKCADFTVTGDGSDPAWQKAEWIQLIKLDRGGEDYKSQFKIMYSQKGIYLLFDGKDRKITTKFDKDFDNLFEGDVFEAFFHPDPEIPIYLEYEINQLNKELVLIIPNLKGKIHGWIPWHYENELRVQKKISIKGGEMKPGGAIQSWSAELFFPYGLFSPLSNVPPVSGMTWNANFYRLDYDSGKMIKYAWTPVDQSFHEFKKYQAIKFE